MTVFDTAEVSCYVSSHNLNNLKTLHLLDFRFGIQLVSNLSETIEKR